MKVFTRFLACLLLLFLFLSATNCSFAASLSFSASGQTFSYTDEIPLHVKLAISSADETTYYLRGVFYKDGSSNYCGLTWNGSAYYSGPYTTNDGWKNFLKISIKDNSWEGDIKVKIDSEDSGCKDSGDYKARIERFTESGSGTFDSQDSVTITFSLPTPTLAPTLTPKPSPTSRPTPTTKVITPTKASVSNTSQNTSSDIAATGEEKTLLSPKPNIHFINYKSSEEAVLSKATESGKEDIMETLSPTSLPVRVLGTSTSLWPFIFSTIGGGILILCAILAFRIYKRNN